MAVVGAVAAVAALAVGGYESKRGHDQKVQASHRADEAEARQVSIEGQLDAQQAANKKHAADQLAYNRQRALAIGAQGRAGTIRTSPLGVPAAPRVGGNSYLGAA